MKATATSIRRSAKKVPLVVLITSVLYRFAPLLSSLTQSVLDPADVAGSLELPSFVSAARVNCVSISLLRFGQAASNSPGAPPFDPAIEHRALGALLLGPTLILPCSPELGVTLCLPLTLLGGLDLSAPPGLLR
jgi:hypothetical protein